jgi:serine/threonine protein kinase
MTPERWQQVNELFAAVIELDPAQQAAFLAQSCSGDPTLRSEIESLIASDGREWNLLESPALEVAAPLLADEQPQLPAGQNIGRYQVVSFIGRGGMGEVYLATDEKLNRRIALKVLPVDYTRDKYRLRRFQQEAQAASALNHPNILTIHELGEEDGRQFIATEFVDGETLRQRLKRLPVNLSETLDTAIQIASALSAAHQADIVHRDIKPENIMLRRDGYVKVLDFGLAKLTEQNEPTAGGAEENTDHSSGLLLGTVKYMSPEQARGMNVDARSDIFSFGVVLYEMIAGRAPFEGETTGDLIAAILKQMPPPISNAPGQLQSLVSKALSKDTKDRYQTIQELIIDLRTVKEGWDLNSSLQRLVQPVVSRENVAQSHRPKSELEATDTARRIEYLISEIKQHKVSASLVLAALLIAVIGISLGLSELFKPRRAGTRFQNMTVTRLTTSGNAASPAVSPDGKSILYGREESEKVSLWLREIATNTEIEILPPTEGKLGGAAFSPDGNQVYYSINTVPNAAFEFSVFQIPVSGGVATRLPINVAGGVSVSPDGTHLAYVRQDASREESAVLTAAADGTDERVILKRQARYGVLSASWSPQGTSIACARFTGPGKVRIVEVNVVNGTEEPISSQEWASVRGVAWLHDMSGLILVASSEALGAEQIWLLPFPTGEARRLTNDGGSFNAGGYRGISLSSDGRTLITERFENQSRIWTVPVDPSDPLVLDMSRAKQISVNRFEGSHGLSFTPNGRIVYSSEEGGRFSIWIMDSDGGNPRYLTDNGVDPVASPDGRYIVFTSINDAGIWRMDLDGGNLKQLTSGRSDYAPSFSPDGKWVVYNSQESGQPTVSKVSIEAGAPVRITSSQSRTPWFSPDGKLIAYGYFKENSEPRLGLISSEGGQPIKTFVLPGSYLTLEWTPDGKALTYLVRGRDGPGNIWAQSIAGGPPRQLTNFTVDRLVNNTWSRDGKRLAFVRATNVRDIVLISDLQ